MQQGLSVPSAEPVGALEVLLRREGWSLHQRLETAAAAAAATAGEPPGGATLAGWRQIVAPDNRANFDKRLRWDGLSEASAAWALDPPPEATPSNPAWWQLLEALRQAGRDAAGGTAHRQLAERGGDQPFVHLWRPAAAWALESLQQRCANFAPQLVLAESAWLDLGEALLERLCTTADQALWELFNQRRSPGQMLLAHLGTNGDGSGRPVHEAYDAFVAELLGSGYGLLLGEFPVLGRLLAVVSQLWLEGSEEMLRRLAASRSDLHQAFGIEPGVVLHTIQQGLSDPHRGGRVVAILTFGSAERSRKVVYKPKDMQVDLAYQQFLQQINAASSQPALRCLKVVSREGFGLMEWVEHRTSTCEEELERFYSNAGRLMAVLHLLGCTDCHHENLIACGDQLVLIDTETLLEADGRDLTSDDGDNFLALSELQTSIQSSVLRSGLLPQWRVSGAARKWAYDISALGIHPPQPESEVPGWLGINSDGMMPGRSKQPSELPTSLPVGLGQPQRLTDFVSQLCTGFANQLHEAIKMRALLLAGLKGFNGKPRRMVARATQTYSTIQRQMLAPAALQSAAIHGLKLEQLSRSFLLASETPLHWPLFQAEIRQMEQLDIPFFEHPIDGQDLPLSHGLTSITSFFKNSGLAAAHQRVANLDTSDIEFQLQLIRGATAARHIHSTADPVASSSDSAPISSEAEPVADDYLQQAYQLGEELWSASIRNQNGWPEWLGIDLCTDSELFHFGLIGSSLYSGSSGIALTFARLGLDCKKKGDSPSSARWLQRAWACFEPIAELAHHHDKSYFFGFVRDLPYGLIGSGGSLLALLLLKRAGVVEAEVLAHHWISQLQPNRLLSDTGIDVIGGVAGLIGPLLLARSSRAKELAILCGDRLLAIQLEEGGWPQDLTSSFGKQPLTGFSHGAAGMAVALARLAQATAEPRFADAARRAIVYERSVFDATARNWPDFRISPEPTTFMSSWCHGAPGVLLGRHLLQTMGLTDSAMEEEIAAARSSTIEAVAEACGNSDFPANLCCGLLGLTGLLRFDAKTSGIPLASEVIRAESALFCQAQAAGNHQFFAVETGSVNLPGLFTGKSGVALALLEAATRQEWLPQVFSAGLLEW